MSKKKKKPFWERGLNPLTMKPPLSEPHLRDTNENKYKNSSPLRGDRFYNGNKTI